ncbi:ComEC/Rec2 family competence protein [Vreelandella venusta]|uniref:ComEC/Rec2 family competence protein n=1 Tax=Vreelandella venusta TaxID=44935 RepID=UPI003F680D15
MEVVVFNVGQGDSILLRPAHHCVHRETPFLIDCGPQRAKVSDRLGPEKHNLLLTHSHHDHIGGFPKIYREKRIESLMLPFYMPEIMSIAKFLGRKIPNKYGSLDWRKVKKVKNLYLVVEGDSLCGHIDILNPPLQPRDYFSLYLNEDANLERSLGILNDYGFDLPIDEIINYESPLDKDSIRTQGELGELEEREYLVREFVHLFFITLSQRLAGNDISSASYYSTTHMEMTANQASIVFKCKHSNGDWLFTGDADQYVFDRLIKSSTDITAKYLKVPHHGSRENLTASILETINPEVAIISHDNRKFGRSRDPHPHHEVIDILDTQGVRSYYTNEVKKGSAIVKPSTVGRTENGCLFFR